MAMVRPSLVLHMDLDESVFSEDVASDIERSYDYVAPSLVSSHEAHGSKPENILHFAVKLRRPYWDSSDAASNELWDGVMPKWLSNMFYKVSSTMVAHNKVRCEKNENALVFDWIEVAFEPHAVVTIRLGSDSSIPDGAVALVEQARALLNGRSFEKEVACVRIPSRASYSAQLEAALATPENSTEETSDGPASTCAPFNVDYRTWGIEFANGSVFELAVE